MIGALAHLVVPAHALRLGQLTVGRDPEPTRPDTMPTARCRCTHDLAAHRAVGDGAPSGPPIDWCTVPGCTCSYWESA